MTKTILIELLGDDLGIKTQGEFKFEETMLALCNTVLHLMEQFSEAVPEGDREKAREVMYHFMNERFSALLERFAPNIEMRPNLTVDAIMKAQNELLMSEMPNTTGDV